MRHLNMYLPYLPILNMLVKSLSLSWIILRMMTGHDDGWCEVQFISLVEEIVIGVPTEMPPNVSVYPNPASDILYIQGAQVNQVNIYSVIGKLEKSITGYGYSRD